MRCPPTRFFALSLCSAALGLALLAAAPALAQDAATGSILEEVASPETTPAAPANTQLPPPAATDPATLATTNTALPPTIPAAGTIAAPPSPAAPENTATPPPTGSVVSPAVMPPPAGIGSGAMGQNMGQAMDAASVEGTGDAAAAEGVVNPPDGTLTGMSTPNPGMVLPTDDTALENLENDPAALQEALRGEAYDASVSGLMPLRPEEIRKFLRAYDETQGAVQSPLDEPPVPEMGITTVSLDPGAPPQTVQLAVGNVTTLNIVDVSGQPWPIQDLGWAGNFEILQPESGSHVLRITPISQYAYGNVSLRLVGLNTPVVLTLKTSKEKVYYRLDIRVPDYGPRATPPLIDAGITTKAGDKTLTSVLEGVPPDKATKMIVEGIDGRTSAYMLDGQTYVRTPYTLLSPAWTSSVKSADGMNVYAIESTPVLLLSDRGKMVRATLREDVEPTNEF